MLTLFTKTVLALTLVAPPVIATNARLEVQAPLVTPATELIEIINASVTAYSSVESCHYPGCIMASGKKAYVGAAACPRSIPLGTQIQIDNKTYSCEDRTAKWIETKYGPAFDIFFGYGSQAHSAALRWGRQSLPVTILPP